MDAQPVGSRWSRAARAALPVFVLLAVCAKSTADGWRAHDLTASDETQYVVLAAQRADPDAHAELNPLYAPLYVAWYGLLSRLPLESEFLPYVSHALLLTILAALFYALVRRLGTGRWLGAFAASALILHTKLATVVPFPVHLATALLAAGTVAATFRRSLLGACGPIGFALLAACYARNEFGTVLLAFLAAYLACGLWACRHPAGRREFLPWAAPLLAAVGACHATLGLPLPDGPRGVFAFGQHYARNVAETTGGGDAVWNMHWRSVVAEEFGDVRTVGEAAGARPRAFAWHLWRNVSRLPGVAVELVRPKLELSNTFRTPGFVLVQVVLGVGLVGTLRRVRAGGPSGPAGQPLRAAALALVLAAAVGGASAVLVYPREHYLVLPLFFVMALAVAGLPAPRWPAKRLGAPTPGKARAAGCAAALLLLSAAPTATHGSTLLRPLVKRPAEVSFEVRETAALLRTLPPRSGTFVLLHRSAVPVMTGGMAPPVHFIPHQLKAEGFRAFVGRYDIGVVVLDRALRADERFATDPEFLALWDETDPGAFAVLRSPGGHRVAVRRDLLTAP